MPKLLNKDHREYLSGALILLLGLGAMIQGRTYRTGSLTEMGPGFFPVALGAVLTFFGIALLIAAKLSAPRVEADFQIEEEELPSQWVAWIHILVAIATFVILGKYGGLVPATFALVFISAIGDRENTFRNATILAVSMTAVAIVIFWWALRLQFALFTWG